MSRNWLRIIVPLLLVGLLVLTAACAGSPPPQQSTGAQSSKEAAESAATQVAPEATLSSVESQDAKDADPTATPAPTETPAPSSTPTETPVPPTPTPPPVGLSRANPHPVGHVVEAPNWELEAAEVVRGEDAWAAIKAANQFNDPPGDGMEYLLARIRAKCLYEDANEHNISRYDFAATGDDRVRYGAASVVLPEPALDAKLLKGGQSEGWVAFEVGVGEGNLILVFDEMWSFSDSGVRYIALDQVASVLVDPELRGLAPNSAEASRAAPIELGGVLITEDWEVSIAEVVRGAEALALVQEANQFNDPPLTGMEFVAFRARVRNIGDEDSSAGVDESCFRATGDANILHDRPFAVEPEPALDASLYPGGETEGWVVVAVLQGETSTMVRFEPLLEFTDENQGFLALEDGASLAPDPALKQIAPTDAGRSRDQAVPLGEDAVTEDWVISVQEVIRGDQAWELVQEANQFNDPADEGMEYLAIRLRAQYIGEKEGPEQVGETNLSLSGSAQVVHDVPPIVDPAPQFEFDLYPGGQIEGWTTLQAEVGEEDLVLAFGPILDLTGRNTRYLSLD